MFGQHARYEALISSKRLFTQEFEPRFQLLYPSKRQAIEMLGCYIVGFLHKDALREAWTAGMPNRPRPASQKTWNSIFWRVHHELNLVSLCDLALA